MLPANSQIVRAQTPLGMEYTTSFSIDETLPGVSSHFPQQPVIAGYMQLQWVESFLAEIAPTLRIGCIRDAKFLHPLLPPAQCQLRVFISAEQHLLQFSLNQGSNTLTKGALDLVSCDY